MSVQRVSMPVESNGASAGDRRWVRRVVVKGAMAEELESRARADGLI